MLKNINSLEYSKIFKFLFKVIPFFNISNPIFFEEVERINDLTTNNSCDIFKNNLLEINCLVLKYYQNYHDLTLQGDMSIFENKETIYEITHDHFLNELRNIVSSENITINDENNSIQDIEGEHITSGKEFILRSINSSLKNKKTLSIRIETENPFDLDDETSFIPTPIKKQISKIILLNEIMDSELIKTNNESQIDVIKKKLNQEINFFGFVNTFFVFCFFLVLLAIIFLLKLIL